MQLIKCANCDMSNYFQLFLKKKLYINEGLIPQKVVEKQRAS